MLHSSILLCGLVTPTVAQAYRTDIPVAILMPDSVETRLVRASVRQRKTGRLVHFEITEQTRQAIVSRVGVKRLARAASPCRPRHFNPPAIRSQKVLSPFAYNFDLSHEACVS